jgi:phosphatidate cytidylyltransferase
MAPPDERDRGGEDLFEDLDKFFEPIDEGWPDEAPAEAGSDAPATVGSDAPPVVDDMVIDLRDPAPERSLPAPAEASLTQVGAGGTVGGPDLLASASGGDSGDDGPTETGQGEVTSEMSGEDWRRLREVLGEDDETPAGPPDPPEPDVVLGEAPDETETFPREETEADARAAWGPAQEAPAEPEEDDARPGVTLDDLKKAPPEYRDLPIEENEDVVELLDPEPVAPSSPEAPAPADVEAAADMFAESVRRETGEHPPVAHETAVEAAGVFAAASPGSGDDDVVWEEGDEESAVLPVPVMEESGTEPPIEDPLGIGAAGGPTWEEPTSHSVLHDLVPPGLSERNLPAALITAGVLIVAAIVSLWISKAAFAVVASIIVLMAQAELYATMHRRGYQPATALGLVVGAMLLAGAYLRGEPAMVMFVALGAVLSFLWYMAAAPKAREGALRNIGLTLLGIVYVPFLAGYALILLSQPSMGTALVLSVLGVTFLYDIAAFAVGSFYGKRPLAPTISPKKSWEGLSGATLVTLFVGTAVFSNIAPIQPSIPKAIGLALVIVIFAPLGDLAESLIKRDLRVKDMGTLLPGHGGVLDRIDSVLFVLPAAWYFLRLVAS